MRLFALLLTFCVCAPLAAQSPIPDTTEAWRYFPLEIGNVWEYRIEISLLPPSCFPNCLQNWRRTVNGDSTIGDFTYQAVLLQKFNLGGEEIASSNEFYRLDTLSAEIRTPFGNPDPAFGGTECGLDAPFPPENEHIVCDATIFEVIGVGYEQQVEIGGSTFLSAVKRFSAYFANYTYASGVGLISWSLTEGEEFDARLTYANVNGTEYGTAFPVAVESANPVRSGLAITPAYPNPSVGQFSISLSSSKPQQVAVEIFDLLGRRVYSEEHVAGAGETTLHLDGSNWPRGLYLVRVTTAEGQTATVRITRQ